MPEAVTRSGLLCKKVFLEISQNSQENTCARVSFLIFFNKVAVLRNRHRQLRREYAYFLSMVENGAAVQLHFHMYFTQNNHFLH